MPHDTLTCVGNIDRLEEINLERVSLVIADHVRVIHWIRTELVARQWVGEGE